MAVGQGEVVLWQVDHRLDSEKVRRGWARLLANLGAGLATPLFTYRKAPADLGIPAFMGIARQPYMDEAAMTAYFSDPGYILNNLGEGVFGWMQRQDKRAGRVVVPNSAGQSWFLTVFVESEVNRDPEQRGTDVLPDPSLVPDLYPGDQPALPALPQWPLPGRFAGPISRAGEDRGCPAAPGDQPAGPGLRRGRRGDLPERLVQG